ncbi:MAG: hypothetical protein ACI4IW_05520 [Oscillospiraceae bacterium]
MAKLLSAAFAKIKPVLRKKSKDGKQILAVPLSLAQSAQSSLSRITAARRPLLLPRKIRGFLRPLGSEFALSPCRGFTEKARLSLQKAVEGYFSPSMRFKYITDL